MYPASRGSGPLLPLAGNTWGASAFSSSSSTCQQPLPVAFSPGRSFALGIATELVSHARLWRVMPRAHVPALPASMRHNAWSPACLDLPAAPSSGGIHTPVPLSQVIFLPLSHWRLPQADAVLPTPAANPGDRPRLCLDSMHLPTLLSATRGFTSLLTHFRAGKAESQICVGFVAGKFSWPSPGLFDALSGYHFREPCIRPRLQGQGSAKPPRSRKQLRNVGHLRPRVEPLTAATGRCLLCVGAWLMIKLNVEVVGEGKRRLWSQIPALPGGTRAGTQPPSLEIQCQPGMSTSPLLLLASPAQQAHSV